MEVLVVKVAKLPNQEDYLLVAKSVDNDAAEVEDDFFEKVSATGFVKGVDYGMEEVGDVLSVSYAEAMHQN